MLFSHINLQTRIHAPKDREGGRGSALPLPQWYKAQKRFCEKFIVKMQATGQNKAGDNKTRGILSKNPIDKIITTAIIRDKL